MVFNDLEYYAVKKEVELFVGSKRPPAHLRDQVDLAYRIKNQTIELFQIRPTWQGEPGELTELHIAKITYFRTQKAWRIFWLRGDLKWALYDVTYALADALELVREDRHGCFWG